MLPLESNVVRTTFFKTLFDSCLLGVARGGGMGQKFFVLKKSLEMSTPPKKVFDSPPLGLTWGWGGGRGRERVDSN